MTVYAERRKKLLSLARGKRVVATDAVNMFYLTDFFGDGAALVLPDKTVVVTSPLEAGRAAEVGHEVEVLTVPRGRDIGGRVMKQLGSHEAIADDDGRLGRSKQVQPRPDLFLEARRTKDAQELERIEKASKGLDRIFDALPAVLRPGRSEWDVAAQVMKMATEFGLTPSDSDSALSPTIIASGPNGALPHSELTGRKLKAGDFVVADIFFRYRGYNSDETRTFAVGRASKDMRKHYEVVHEAQEKAFDAAKLGVQCGDINEAAVDVLRKNKVERFLTHSVGHGVGIQIHELPSIARGIKTRLMKNDVITDEPGLYFPGKYGIRIEDTLRADSTPVRLTRSTRDLIVCG